MSMKIEQTWISCKSAKLYAELRIPDSEPSPAVLICHGMNARGSSGLRLYARLAEASCKAGFVSLLFDFRGVGNSTGNFDYGFGEQEDIKCMLEYLAARPEVANDKIFVIGHSLGGVVSLYALRKERRVKGLVLWSTPKNHRYNVKKFVRQTRGKIGLYEFLILSYLDKFFNVSKYFKLEVYGVNLRLKLVREKLMKLDECDAVSKLDGVPVLIAIGSKDPIVGVYETKEIYRSANKPKDMLIIDEADHVYKGKENQLITKTLEWIKKTVA